MSAYNIGMRAERIAEELFRCSGWKVLARNYRGPAFEIDLVVADSKTLIFVEIKYRKYPLKFFDLAGLINFRKRKSLYLGARKFLTALPADRHPEVFRFDLVFLCGNLEASPEIHYFENIMPEC